MNIIGPILHFGRIRKSAPALTDGIGTITYGELAGLVLRTAGHLIDLGVRRGDRIGLCLKDTCDHVILLLAVAHMGGVAVPLDWRARPAENVRFIDGLGLQYILAEPDRRVEGGALAFLVDARWHERVSQADLYADSSSDWNDAFVISASSGSTGFPKFTLMTHQQYFFAMAGMFELMALKGCHRFLCNMPLYYSGGRNSCLAHLLRGDCVVLYPNLFSPAEYLDVVRRERITVAGLVPTTMRQLLTIERDGPLLPELDLLFSTGAPLYPEEKRQAARKLTPNFHERYGTAETLAISVLRPEDFDTRPDSVGQPHSLAEIQVVDENDRNVSVRDAGRLRYRGPGLGSPLPGGAELSFRNGWYYPGEIARLDDEGYIFLLGRTSDVIMRGGAKIYPAEIEAMLIEHPSVIEAAVIGQRGPDNEEAVIAFVVAPGGDTGELLAHCRGRLTAYKVPRQIHFVDLLPKNTGGKIDKVALGRRFVVNASL